MARRRCARRQSTPAIRVITSAARVAVRFRHHTHSQARWVAVSSCPGMTCQGTSCFEADGDDEAAPPGAVAASEHAPWTRRPGAGAGEGGGGVPTASGRGAGRCAMGSPSWQPPRRLLAVWAGSPACARGRRARPFGPDRQLRLRRVRHHPAHTTRRNFSDAPPQ